MPANVTDNNEALGLKHRHAWQAFAALPRLQAAHDHLHWDVSKSRILSFNACVICDDVERDSMVECSDEVCAEHRICIKPYH